MDGALPAVPDHRHRPVPCWVASLGYFRLASRRVFIPQEANTTFVEKILGDREAQALAGAHDANTLFSVASLQLRGAYSFMHVYGQAEREQIAFWEALLDEQALEGKLFQFDVVLSSLLPQRVPLLQCSSRCLRGLVVALEAGQAARLWGMLAPATRAAIGHMPKIALRLPPQHAICIARRTWKSVLVPHIPRMGATGGRGGSRNVTIDWQLLSIQKPECAELPEALRSEPELDASTCLQIADRLRHVAACVDRGTEFGADDYHCLETFVHVLQKGA